MPYVIPEAPHDRNIWGLAIIPTTIYWGAKDGRTNGKTIRAGWNRGHPSKAQRAGMNAATSIGPPGLDVVFIAYPALPDRANTFWPSGPNISPKYSRLRSPLATLSGPGQNMKTPISIRDTELVADGR